MTQDLFDLIEEINDTINTQFGDDFAAENPILLGLLVLAAVIADDE